AARPRALPPGSTTCRDHGILAAVSAQLEASPERAMSNRKPSMAAALVIVASFATGRADAQSKMWDVIGTGRADGLGHSLTYTPDADGDGVPDLLVGAPNTYGPHGTSGRVLLYSGATLGRIREFDGDAPRDSFGAIVASLGDVDGDGLPDFAIS